MASSVISASRDVSPRHDDPAPSTSNPPAPSVSSAAAVEGSSMTPIPAEQEARGSFEPEKADHLVAPNGGYYAGSRKDYPLPANRYPLPRASVQRLLEPEPGTEGGRQRHYLDDPAHPIQGFWTESGTFKDWPPKSPPPPDAEEAEPPAAQGDSQTRRSSADNTSHNMTVSATVGTRRQANGTIGSVYSGNKIRHLKKDDGIPLWRKDIQYEFLKLVFENKQPVFTRLSDGKKGLDFADIYIDAMARSSKTSKILKDKLQNDKAAAISMAMVCLLVNFGRMNTTLNFFPEMRAQLRTYHSIPSLQAHQDPNAYKQLQDAPRLKSILKGASEDTDQPNTVEKIKELPVPRTNPVNLIFVLAQYAPRISELHFFAPRDFFDLVMRSSLSSRSRAQAFLWLMWYYLESDFSVDAALNNPFGAGLVGEGTEGLPLKVPIFEPLTETEADAENVDTAEEIKYGEEKQRERKRILEDDETNIRFVKRPKKVGSLGYNSEDEQGSGDISMLSGKGDRHSFGGRQASAASTPLNPGSRRGAPHDEDGWETPIQGGRRYKRAKRESSTNRSSLHGSQPRRIVLKTRMDQTPDTVSPAPPGAAHPVLNQFGNGSPAAPAPGSSRRPRPLTQHQLAVEQNRRERVEYILAQRRGEALKEIRDRRKKEMPFARSLRLLRNLPDDYDTEDENSWGKGGICPNPDEEEDYGEAAGFYLSIVKRVSRRLQRWDWDSMVEDAKKAETDAAAAVKQDDAAPAYVNGAHDAEVDVVTPSARAKPKRRPPKRKPRVTQLIEDEPERKPRGRGGARSRSSAGSAAGTVKSGDAHDASDNLPVPSSPRAGLNTTFSDDVSHVEEDDTLDDIDKELLGETSGAEEEHPPTDAPAADSQGQDREQDEEPEAQTAPSSSRAKTGPRSPTSTTRGPAGEARYLAADSYRDSDIEGESTFIQDSGSHQQESFVAPEGEDGDTDDMDEDGDVDVEGESSGDEAGSGNEASGSSDVEVGVDVEGEGDARVEGEAHEDDDGDQVMADA